MCIGTILIVVGWAMLNAASPGTNHQLTPQHRRISAELGYLNTFIAGGACSFISYFTKKYFVRDHHKLP
jgi:ammonia channel protein AmtB